MLLRYIGKNGYMRLITGQVYETKVFTRGNAIHVSWIVPGERGTRHCPYNSPMALAKNWEGVK